ncbi:hypothetical protein KIS4809_2906 [Bacillus sp. ZZV12-4809]|nr:hypothetical protein KIS4809_2906 [Bacillus sp. ZZV12-4809]
MMEYELFHWDQKDLQTIITISLALPLFKGL